MPIENNATPTVVHVVGYSGEVQGESSCYDMWYDYDDVTGYEGTDNHVMLHSVDTSSGLSAVPVD